MTGIYVVELVDVLAAAGVAVAVADVNAGWETRARNSGGFPAPPLAVFWHHTASKTTPVNDLNFMIHGSEDAPVGNMLLDRDGIVWPVAAGASNCAGKGGPAGFTRGTIPVDQGNTHGWQVEAANNGVGEPWPTAQIDAYHTVSNALNHHFGNGPADVITHNVWAPSRKIDPATAAAVQGPWAPAASTSSGTWDLADVIAETVARNTTNPPPVGDDRMYLATLEDGTVVVAGSAVRPVSADEIAPGGPFAGLPRFTPDPASTWHWWLAAGAAEYVLRVG